MNERFSCVRLSLFPRWKEKIEDFENDMNPNLVDYLKNVAFARDSESLGELDAERSMAVT